MVEGNNYKTQSINLLQKPEIPKECTMVIVGGPSRDYLQPAVDALKNYVENGGKAILMLDPPLKFAKQNVDNNAALVSMLASWGVTADKDVIAYCRIGERSSYTWFALKYLIGLSHVQNYDGSWTEWGNLVGAPVERGASA